MNYSHSPMLKIALLICIAMTGLPSILSAQISGKFPKGLGIEIGGGHNQLFWDPSSRNLYDRTAYSLMPSARMHFLLPIAYNVEIYSFAGYNEFGGHSGKEGEEEISVYTASHGTTYIRDRIRIQNLETGILGLYNISNVRIGIGAKIYYHLQISDRHRNFPPSWFSHEWDSTPHSYFFGDWSYDGGFRAEYMGNAGITFGAEGWFGMSNLASETASRFDIRQNHFRVLVGYRFH